jgi:hypothetical protein
MDRREKVSGRTSKVKEIPALVLDHGATLKEFSAWFECIRRIGSEAFMCEGD